MATKKKMLQAAAGNAGGEALDITDVFSTYLYTGNATARSITNGIDLAGEGGLVWTKFRGSSPAALNANHYLFDTETTTTFPNKWLATNSTAAAATGTGSHVTSFNSNGWSMGAAYHINQSDLTYASWTFRKAPKFFDVVTYTGTGSPRTIAHNLGCEVGFMTIKKTSQTGDWLSFHRSATGKWLMLNSTDAATTNVAAEIFGNDSSYIAPSSTVFSIGSESGVNANGQTYVAYLFAHNDGDGEFGPDGDQDIIKCGSYTGNGSTDGPEIDLGFEPQWVMIKSTSRTGDWTIFDSLRGVPTGGNDSRLHPNTTQVESSSADIIDFNSTGFKLTNTFGDYNGNGETYIYMAIRRGPLAQPESGTEVFAIDTQGSTGTATAPAFRSGWPIDFVLFRRDKNLSIGQTRAISRLTGTNYSVTSDGSNNSNSDYFLDYMNGWNVDIGTDANRISWMWRRAPGYFDAVAYTGNGTAGRTVSHNLGVAPEMMWVKNRNASSNWQVYHKGLNGGTNPANYWLKLNDTDAESALSNKWNDTEPTQSVFSVGNSSTCNASGNNYIAYLFATLPGVSKVGSYTGNGSSQTIDCGFTSGARFVLIKCSSDGLSDWHVMDSTRGIVAGNDPFLYLNDTTAEDTGEDMIDPYSSGFALAANNRVNASGRTYIFYAIA